MAAKSSSTTSRRRMANRRNWAELPGDVTATILSRLTALDILTSAKNVCKSWRRICKDPMTWRSIDMGNNGTWELGYYDLEKICRHAVDLSSGHLAGINIPFFGSDNLLDYISNSSSGIRHLRLVDVFGITDKGLREMALKLPLLEDLEILSGSLISGETLETFGRSCPLLTSLRLEISPLCELPYDRVPYAHAIDEHAHAIAGTMRGLHHLQLFGSKLSDDGIKEIRGCCLHLVTFDVGKRLDLDSAAGLRNICGKKIHALRFPS